MREREGLYTWKLQNVDRENTTNFEEAPEDWSETDLSNTSGMHISYIAGA